MDVMFRQDPIGLPATTAGTLHVAFAGVASLLTILAIALIASWALAWPELRGFGWYSVATLVVIAVSGPVAAVATARLWPTMGPLERLPIFGFVQWAAFTLIILARWRSVSPRPTQIASYVVVKYTGAGARFTGCEAAQGHRCAADLEGPRGHGRCHGDQSRQGQGEGHRRGPPVQ